jgi:hypothetical protein
VYLDSRLYGPVLIQKHNVSSPVYLDSRLYGPVLIQDKLLFFLILSKIGEIHVMFVRDKSEARQ